MIAQFKARVFFVCFFLLVLCGFVIARLFVIQVIDADRYAARSRDQTQKRTLLSARRGTIYDRKGRVLAISMKDNVSVNMDVFLSDKGHTNKKTLIKRVYPHGELAGPVLGYVGRDGYGLGGVEYTFDSHLRGEDGWTMLTKDGRNHLYRKIGLPYKDSRDGRDLYLTVDLHVQKIVQNVLRQTVQSLNAKGGQAIVMDPHTGHILAMASEPSFNPNIPASYSLADRQNMCISAIYEPGSTFKVVTAAAAMQEKITNEQDIYYGNNGVYEVYDQVIRDHEAYGYLTFSQALSYSSNVCFAQIADKLGNGRLYKYTRDFGMGVKTNVDLPGEESGILHPVRSWSGRTRVTMAMGQEVSTTFLQMMLLYAAVANGGVLVTPVIYHKVVDTDGKTLQASSYKPVRRILDESVSTRLSLMLRQVVDEGTGRNAAISNLSIAGKTGTSQKPDSSGYSRTRNWSSFIGFVPAESPALLCGVLIDEPQKNETGGVAAAPAFKKIMTQIMSHPELEYAEKMLDAGKPSTNQNFSAAIPMVCGLSKKKALAALDSSGIRCRFIGVGDTVMFQTPSAGTMIDKRYELVLFIDPRGRGVLSETVVIPDCTGKDLRDAVNIVNLKGLVPFAVGSGRVHRQVPSAGSLIKTADVCTLLCAFNG